MSAEEGAKTSATMDFIGKTVNFLILFGGLAFVLRKPLAAMLGKRSLDIQEALRQAQESKAGAEEKYREAEAKITGLEAEVRRLIEAAEAEARANKDRIAVLAAEESRRLRKFAEQESDQQVRAGLQELKAYAAQRATELARERIRQRLTPADQATLIDKSIERLSEFHEKSGSR
jgi:F-type H+-transporting ATPase subunit b